MNLYKHSVIKYQLVLIWMQNIVIENKQAEKNMQGESNRSGYK